MTGWQLAQINVGTLQRPEGDPKVHDFFANLERINALAEASDGFVWRFVGEEGGNATDIRPAPDNLFIVNMSVWRDADALFAFVYRSAHTPIMARRREFFQRPQGAFQALWWVETGHRPSVDEGLAKLWLLERYGPSPLAFGFKSQFPVPGLAGPPIDHRPDPWCVGNA